jgi:proteic killer suppression protein
MIRSFKDKKTEQFFAGESVKAFSRFKKQAERKLIMLDSAIELPDLQAPPSNRLEKPKGDRGGQRSIRMNDQWRICFVWKDDGPHEVEIADYH